MTLKVSTATWLHILLITSQVLNALGGIVPQKYQVFVAAGLALVQMIVGKIQHNSPVPPPVQ